MMPIQQPLQRSTPSVSNELESPSPLAPGEILLGTLSEVDENGRLWVTYFHGSLRRVATSTMAVGANHIGRQVALLFINGDLHQPLIVGFIHTPFETLLTQPVSRPAHHDIDVFGESAPNGDVCEVQAILNATAVLDEGVLVDEKKKVIDAPDELVLRCGESSITLTKAGTIKIQGKYLVSRSTGVNRIQGGSVNIN